jgi:exopolysaccharide biosynthesis protein
MVAMAALTPVGAAATPGVAVSTKTVATPAGARPAHMITVTPGSGARLEAVWLGGRLGRTGTVGSYVTRNAKRGAVGGLNGDFFVLATKRPSGNLFIRGGRSYLGNTTRATVTFAADGSVDVIPGASRAGDLLGRGVTEAMSGKPVYVLNGRAGNLSLLEGVQRTGMIHRAAVGRLKNGQTALVVVGGAGTTGRQFSTTLIRLGFEEALGMDLNSSANVNWRGRSLNRPSYQRSMPTGIIVFRP